MLLLVIKSSKEEIITGKVFEYLASGRPILAITPPGELSEMIETANAGTILDFQNISKIKQAIFNYYQQHLKETLPTQANASVSQFERKYLTEILVNIVNRLAVEGECLEN